MRYFLFVLFRIFQIAPKIIILGPPTSGRHTIAKMLQKKLNTVLIEPNDLLHDVPRKFKDKLPANPMVVCILIRFFFLDINYFI